MSRIDKLIIPGGLIRRARTYSLVNEQGNLFVVNTGRAATNMQHASGRYAFAKAAQVMWEDHFAKEIADGEVSIGKIPLTDLVKGKNNVMIPLGDIVEVSCKLKPSGPTMMVVTKNKKYKFVSYDNSRLPELEGFAKGLK